MVFGSLAEHLGRCVYHGIYKPDHQWEAETLTHTYDAVEDLGDGHFQVRLNKASRNVVRFAPAET